MAEAVTGRYLTFVLADELFAVPVGRVEVVLEMQKVTRVPNALPYIRGLTNHRGSVIPVVDPRIRLEGAPVDLAADPAIIVLQLDFSGEALSIGMLADGVREVMDLDESLIEAPPKLGSRMDSRFIQGIGKNLDGFVVILDLDAAFAVSSDGVAL
ncbi:MAG: chemotaxis protein CheW [Spirochaetota bacterium]